MNIRQFYRWAFRRFSQGCAIWLLFVSAVLLLWVWSSLFICEFQIVRWRETILKFKRLSATCTCFCRLSLSACLLQLLFQIFRNFLFFVHLTSDLSWFSQFGPNGSFSRADIPRTDMVRRNMPFSVEISLSTICHKYSFVLRLDLLGQVWLWPFLRVVYLF